MVLELDLLLLIGLSVIKSLTSVSNVSSSQQPRGQRRSLHRDSVPERQPEPRERERDRRRVTNRDRETSAERRADLDRRIFSEATRGERNPRDGLRTYLYEDPTLTEPARRVPEGVLRARRHVLTHEESRLFRDSSAQADASREMSSNQPSRDLQRRFSREPAPRRPSDTQLPSFASLTNPALSLPPLRTLNNRRSSTNLSASDGSGARLPRPRASERLTARYRPDRFSNPPNPSTFEGLEYDLDDANTQLRALLAYDPTISSPLSPPANAHTPHHDQTEDSRRVKRRKLDSERPGSNFKGFRYGRFGQVEQGQLKMEIETCDGGIFADDENNPPESILKNDESVYCTKKDSCNIVLRHQGATVFTLSELVIRAPGPSFSAPLVPVFSLRRRQG